MAMKEVRVYMKVAMGGVIDNDSTESLIKERKNNNDDTSNPKVMTGLVLLATFQRTAKFCEQFQLSSVWPLSHL